MALERIFRSQACCAAALLFLLPDPSGPAPLHSQFTRSATLRHAGPASLPFTQEASPMCHLPHISLRLASAIAVVVLLPAWNSDSTLNLKAQTPGGATAAAANTEKTLDSKASPVAAARISSTYGKLPISFEINQGQTDKSVQFLARSSGYTLFLTPGE